MSRLGLGLGLTRQMQCAPAIPLPLATANYTFIAHPAYCFSDASHVVPCNPGDSIQWFYDPSAAAWFQQATSGNRLILRQTGAKYYAESTGSGFHPWANMSALTNAPTIGAAFQFYSLVTYQMVFSNGGLNREIRQSYTSLKVEVSTGGGGSLPESGTFAYNQDLQYIAACATGGGTTSLYKSGTLTASAADSYTGNMGALSSVGSRQGAYIINGRIYGISIFQNNPGVATLNSWLRGLQP